MDVKLDIRHQYETSTAVIQAPALDQEVQEVVAFIEKNNQIVRELTAKKGERVYFLPVDHVVRLAIENRSLTVYTKEDSYQSSLRLYQAMEVLPRYFIQISQSEIINSQQLEYLEATPNGLVKLVMKNGDVTYSSRRYLKTIKEVFGL